MTTGEGDTRLPYAEERDLLAERPRLLRRPCTAKSTLPPAPVTAAISGFQPVGGGSRTEFGSATCAPQPKRNGPAAPLRGDVVADAHSRRRHRSDRREPS